MSHRSAADGIDESVPERARGARGLQKEGAVHNVERSVAQVPEPRRRVARA